jgi:hypothetical protein
MSQRRFVWLVLLTLIGWVAHIGPRMPFGFLRALGWLVVVIFVWAYGPWQCRG